jgi:hypothetical protein
MTFSNRLEEYIAAAFSGLYVLTHEPDEAAAEIAILCRQRQWRLATWDIDRGLAVPGGQAVSLPAAPDPLAAIKSLAALAEGDQTTLLVLRGFHRFLGSAEIIQTLEHQLIAGKSRRCFVIVLAPIVQLPVELERLFLVVEHDLPGRDQLAAIAEGVATESGDFPEGAERDRILDAAAGLTRYEAEAAFALSIVRQERIAPESLWEMKAQALKKSGLLSLYRGVESFAHLGGLEALKAFCLRAITRRSPRVAPRGVLLLGVPGTGKSAFCKALGQETGRPTLLLDVGSLLGSLVGQSELQTRQALKIVDAMAPCILMIDEVEKALSGVASSGHTDSGVGARMFGTILGWLNDHQSDVFVVCTANNVARLPPEFSRAERFDGIFFLDLPSEDQKKTIWRQYINHFDLEPGQRMPSDASWTDAEVRSCCRLSALLDVPLIQAAQNIVPVAVTASETVQTLREWAAGRCLAAERSGVYQAASSPSGSRRRVNRAAVDPSAN